MGLHAVWVTFFIYIGTLPLAVWIIWGKLSELRRSPYLALVIMLASGWCNTAFILALLDGEAVRVVILFYLSPLWAILLARFVLKEPLTIVSYLVVLLAIIGAMIMLWTPEFGYPWPQSTSDWLAISSGIVNDLGGRLTARNGREGGAVFEMQLPILGGEDTTRAAE